MLTLDLLPTSYEGLDMSADQFPSKPPKDVVFSTLGTIAGLDAPSLISC
jgi:hypothetical protein